MWPTSLRARLTLWYTALLALPLIVFAVVSYMVVARTLERRTDRFIGDALSAFSRELVAERRASMSVAEAMRTAVTEVRFRDLNIAILDTSGSLVAMNSTDDGELVSTSRRATRDVEEQLLATVRRRPLDATHALSVAASGSNFRVLSRPLTVDGLQFALTGAYSMRDIDDVLQRIRELFFVAIPLLLLVSVTGGYALARRSLAPVAAMSSRAAAISATNLHERLPVSGSDELVTLASVVNGLLDRLERSFDEQRRFIADASHELRTPTAVVRTEADITLSRAHRSEEEYRESVGVMHDAARRLTRIVDDLFLLTRADAGQVVARLEPLYLEEVLHDASRAVRTVAAARGVRIEVREVAAVAIVGDADLLGQLLLNLLDNAIKYSPDDGAVVVTMTRAALLCTIRVTDRGPGIPADAVSRVFDRFYRADAARSRSDASVTSGAGLGLAIARRIAQLHGGDVQVGRSEPGHTEFVVTLPVS